MPPNKLSQRIGHDIRGTHPYAFRSGQWGRIIDVGFYSPHGREGRWVYTVQYPDGVTDTTPVHDSGYEYEFRINGEITKNA